MRASSLFLAGLAAAIISSAPANAQDAKKPAAVSQADSRTWKQLTNYVDCKDFARGRGWTDLEGWYGCTARKFKN